MLDLCDILIAQQKGENQTEKIYFYRTLHNRPVPIVVNVCLLLIYKVYIARDVKHLEIKFLSELKLMCHSHTPQLYIVWFRQLCCCACQIQMLRVRLHTHIESCNHELINLMVVNVVFYFSLLLLLFGYIMLFSSSFCCPFIARSPAASVWPYICAFTYNLSEVSIARSVVVLYVYTYLLYALYWYFRISRFISAHQRSHHLPTNSHWVLCCTCWSVAHCHSMALLSNHCVIECSPAVFAYHFSCQQVKLASCDMRRHPPSFILFGIQLTEQFFDVICHYVQNVSLSYVRCWCWIPIDATPFHKSSNIVGWCANHVIRWHFCRRRVMRSVAQRMWSPTNRCCDWWLA